MADWETFHQKHFGMQWPYLNHSLDKLEGKALKSNLRLLGVPGRVTHDDFKAFSIQLPAHPGDTRREEHKITEAAEMLPRREPNPVTLNSPVLRLLQMHEKHREFDLS